MHLNFKSILLGLGVEMVAGVLIGTIFGSLIPMISPDLMPESALFQWTFAATILLSSSFSGYVVAHYSPRIKIYNAGAFGLLCGFFLVYGHARVGPHLLELAAGVPVFAIFGAFLHLWFSKSNAPSQ